MIRRSTSTSRGVRPAGLAASRTQARGHAATPSRACAAPDGRRRAGPERVEVGEAATEVVGSSLWPRPALLVGTAEPRHAAAAAGGRPQQQAPRAGGAWTGRARRSGAPSPRGDLGGPPTARPSTHACSGGRVGLDVDPAAARPPLPGPRRRAPSTAARPTGPRARRPRPAGTPRPGVASSARRRPSTTRAPMRGSTEPGRSTVGGMAQAPPPPAPIELGAAPSRREVAGPQVEAVVFAVLQPGREVPVHQVPAAVALRDVDQVDVGATGVLVAALRQRPVEALQQRRQPRVVAGQQVDRASECSARARRHPRRRTASPARGPDRPRRRRRRTRCCSAPTWPGCRTRPPAPLGRHPVEERDGGQPRGLGVDAVPAAALDGRELAQRVALAPHVARLPTQLDRGPEPLDGLGEPVDQVAGVRPSLQQIGVPIWRQLGATAQRPPVLRRRLAMRAAAPSPARPRSARTAGSRRRRPPPRHGAPAARRRRPGPAASRARSGAARRGATARSPRRWRRGPARAGMRSRPSTRRASRTPGRRRARPRARDRARSPAGAAPYRARSTRPRAGARASGSSRAARATTASRTDGGSSDPPAASTSVT